MSTYLKHVGGYTYKQLKGKSFDEIQKLFEKEMKRVNTFVVMGSEVQESKEKKVEGSEETAKSSKKKMLGRKRAGKEQQQESLKKQRMEEDKESDEVKEVKEDDEDELKKHLVIKKDEDIAIDAIPLATKLPVIIDYKLHKEDREDLEALWRIVKTKYTDIRPEDEFERVLWGDLKVIRNYQEEFFTHKEEMTPMALSDSEFNLANYKRGLSSVEKKLVFYRKNEVIFGDKIDVLKRDVSFKDSDISLLKRFFSPPKIDLSNSGLEEFQEPEFEGYGPKTSKSASEDISNEVRKSNDAPLVEKSVMAWVPKKVGFSYLQGNPKTELEDSVRLNSPEDKKSNIDAAQPKLMLLVNIVNAD
ncbi:hypothetical protein Tco_1142844 [Tanacetum coccineum]